MLKAGNYTGKIIAHAISETKDGDPQAVTTFSVIPHEGAQAERITWYGSFKPKAIENTIKSLIVLGLKGSNPGGDVELGKEVALVLKDGQDLKGKPRTEVRFINELGAARNVIPQDKAKAKLASLEGAVMAARAKLGTKTEEIPF